ncbi:glycoside hydrolase family 32 protein [Vagococcus lutrae]|uniref:glycoside hydrolase family 32 protein n=1 Tax=Vagococcus lutrae TaxID=81947 RepID=UPI00200BA990|nr:glycoside hydrolase family 32 protein [Vagococcus lutrae]UQF37538.1 glycoside hydrolase family 32 protein [Vagococcus lutrae]
MLYTTEQANKFIEENQDKMIETYRPKYHLTPPVGWMNDPNGFVYFKGEYHLFYQHYPYQSVWGPMHWGHAKSKDLIHWEHLPVALAPEENYEIDGCFSGSAIEKDGKLYLMYTGHYERNGERRETQCLAYSEDGIHFKKYEKNPVIDESHIEGVADIADFRDPKVFEHDNKYYCVVASKTSDERGRILLFQSSDLINWEYVSILLEGEEQEGIMWECPDLFQLDGKDVLIMSPIAMLPEKHAFHNRSSTIAFIGQVDWQKGEFHVENSHEIDSGLDFYAPQTCEDDEGQRIMVAWMQMWDRNMPTNDLKHGWVGSMTLPRKLNVSDNRLIQTPILSVEESFISISNFKNITLNENSDSFYQILPCASSIKLNIQDFNNAKLIMRIGSEEEYVELTLNNSDKLITIDRAQSGYDIVGAESEPLRSRSYELLKDTYTLEIFVDISTLEVFLDDVTAFSLNFYQKQPKLSLEMTSSSEVMIDCLDIKELDESC